MNADAVFRPYVIGIFVAMMAIALPFRIKSQSTGEKLDRLQEGLFILIGLRLAGAALWFGAIAFMINPDWMACASLPFPNWVRWAGVAVGFVTPLLLLWTLKTLGPNLTDTVVTRQSHTLVTRGPYRWVRHPFYDCMALFVLSLGLAAANWFVLTAGVVVFTLLAVRTRTEEEKLLARFGDPYREYLARTGRFLPVFLITVAAGLSMMTLLEAQERVTFTALTAGNRFTCALSADGKAYCWGSDVMGQLGVGDPVGRCDESIYAKGACARAPVAVSGDHRFVSISAGDSHTCAIDDEGAVYCWGENHFGQLGIESTPDKCVRESSRDDESTTLACSRTPVRVLLEAPVVSIATGEHMTCAAGESGDVWCWGGPPGTETPTLLEVEDRFAILDAGGRDVCGLTVDDALRCFTWTDVLTEGVTAPWDSADWQTVTLGMGHGCALDGEGAAFCWGSDADGALGIGPNDARHSYDEVAVTAVLGDHVFRSLETGTIRTCGIRENGALYCWGRVPEGRADEQCLDSNGIAATNDCTSRPILVHHATRFAAVSIGARHQCGISTSGVTLCWGDNESGQLGDGTLRSTDRLVEVRTEGVTLAQTRLLDARENIIRWGPRGGAALLVLSGLIFAARRWWRAGAGTKAPRVDHDWIAAGALAAVLAGWLMFGAAILSIGTSSGTGDVAYGLAMMALISGGGSALLLSAIAVVMAAVVLRRDRGAKVAWLALVLAALTLVVGIAAALKMFWPTER